MPQTVLVVDDSATMRQQTRTLLQTNGYTVLEAGNGAEGLEAVKGAGASIGLVIVDVNMPVMNGIEMIGKLRKMDHYGKTPIFVLTTESSGNIVSQGKAAGATAWIVKPFNPQILLAAVKKVLPA
jgi:two-component system, chemotaxis family, chemotaxis protein CheY